MLDEFTLAKKNVISYINDCQGLAVDNGNKTLGKTLSLLCSELENFTLNVAVVGDIKRGKSTLINTLLGRTDDALSPVGVTVCTSAIVKYRNYKPGMEPEPHGIVYYEGEPNVGYRVDYEDLKELISQKFNPDNHKGVRCIDVYGDFPLLGNCCLVDTPGANAAIERHGEMVSEFLPSADAIIMPIMAGQAMTDSEQRMLRSLSENSQRRIFYVLTKVDTVRDAELPKVLDWVRQCIREAGLREPATIYKVACKKVFDAQKDRMGAAELEKLRKDCGITRLENDLSAFMLSHSKEGVDLARRLVGAVDLARNYLAEREKNNELLINAQVVKAEDIEAECRRIQAEFDAYEADMKRRLGRFKTRWNNSVKMSLEGLELQVEGIERAVTELLRKKGFRALFHLGAAISAEVQPRVSETVSRIETNLDPLIELLQQDWVDGVRLYSKRVQTGQWAGTGSALAAVGISATTISMVSVPALTGVIAAINGYIAASGVASVAASGLLPTLASWVGLPAMLSWFGVSTAEAAMLTAGAAVMTSVVSAVFPVIIGIIMWKMTGPLAATFAGKFVPGQIEKAVASVRANLEKQLDEWRDRLIKGCETSLSEQRQETEAKLEEMRLRLRELDPAAKERAEKENVRISALLEQSKQLEVCCRALPVSS